jgi:hypothetical protein
VPLTFELGWQRQGESRQPAAKADRADSQQPALR